MQLRPYQSEDLASIRAKLKAGSRRVLYRLPTGGGKTVVAAFMFASAAQRGMRAWFLCHRRELLKQTSRTFKDAGISHGIIGAGFPFHPKEPIQICGVQTVVNRLDKLAKPHMRVWDEAHHCAAATWKTIHAAHDSIDIGVTATPERLDGKGLGAYFDVMVEGPSVAELIDQGYLCKYKVYAPRHAIDVTRLKMLGGDYNTRELTELVDKSSITGDAVEHYTRLAMGKRAVVFCVSVDHAKHVRDAFINAGIAAAHIDGSMDAFRRDMVLQQFASGEIKALTSVDIISEGFDLPSLEVALCLRPTHSLSLYLQQVGRALRIHPGKEFALILDHAGNVARHGLPDDDREWNLEGRAMRGPKTEAESTKTCPECWRIIRAQVRTCPGCGFVWVPKPREITQFDGNLEEFTRGDIDIAAVADARRKTREARDRAGLEKIAKERGYKKGWVDMMLATREVKQAMGKPVDLFGE
jgi:superfamily II DNA or RNA helicase